MKTSRLLLVLSLLFVVALPAVAQKKLKTAKEYATRGYKYLVEESKPEKALADFEAALKLDSLYCGVYNNIASIKKDKKDFKTALEFYTKAHECARNLNDKTGSIMFMWNRGMCKHEMNDFKGAIQDYDIIIAIDSLYSTGYVQKSLELLSLRQYDESITTAQKILTLPNITEDNKKTVERFNAHAQMLKGNLDAAVAIHKANRDYTFAYAAWKVYVEQEFTEFRKAGLPTENMSKVEAVLGIAQAK